jgi:5-formyltetrahydrofolate cyclo-ligase
VDGKIGEKERLRAEALERRREYARSLTPELRAGLEEQLAEIVLPHLLAAKVVAFYHPLKGEISPSILIDRLAPGQSAVLPWFLDRDSRMLWREVPAVEPSPWGVLQPAAEAEALAPDLVLVPLVAADRRGRRIGHGKGHYDRALSHLREAGPVTAIGIGWESQILERDIPADPWDMPLDALATPKEFIRCR